MEMAIAMFVAFVFLSTWISPQVKRRVVGYGLAADITVHVILQTMFGGDAEGRAGLLFAGIMINGMMHTYRYLHGYEKLTITGWKRYAGVRT